MIVHQTIKGYPNRCEVPVCSGSITEHLLGAGFHIGARRQRGSPQLSGADSRCEVVGNSHSFCRVVGQMGLQIRNMGSS